MKVFISKDELYPVYQASTVRGWYEKEVEVPEELLGKWYEISALFYEMQDQLHSLYEGKE